MMSKKYESTAKYKDLDGNIVVDGSEITVSCISKKCFDTSETNYVVGKSEKDSHPEIGRSARQHYSFCTEDTAKRIATALASLIMANGGRSSQF